MDTILERGMVVFLDTNVNRDSRELVPCSLAGCLRTWAIVRRSRVHSGSSVKDGAGCDVLCHDMT